MLGLNAGGLFMHLLVSMACSRSEVSVVFGYVKERSSNWAEEEGKCLVIFFSMFGVLHVRPVEKV